ncbi:hypothetical protein OCOJLMKI_4816 [Methylobacterium iners]|uniref:Transposase n=1 Tax=Methylobacterium iners TaxID=418707 RepID=A0ABQ4S3C0_9HYPH|nr:hypothetical protein OCOJLMKI_4816 [Methylobacterium iners]
MNSTPAASAHPSARSSEKALDATFVRGLVCRRRGVALPIGINQLVQGLREHWRPGLPILLKECCGLRQGLDLLLGDVRAHHVRMEHAIGERTRQTMHLSQSLASRLCGYTHFR